MHVFSLYVEILEVMSDFFWHKSGLHEVGVEGDFSERETVFSVSNFIVK